MHDDHEDDFVESYFRVPRNAQGEWDLDNSDDETNLDTFTMEYSEIKGIEPIFRVFNKRFGTYIGFEETDKVPAKDVAEALAVVRNSGYKGDAIARLERIFELALERRTFVQISLMLV